MDGIAMKMINNKDSDKNKRNKKNSIKGKNYVKHRFL